MTDRGSQDGREVVWCITELGPTEEPGLIVEAQRIVHISRVDLGMEDA